MVNDGLGSSRSRLLGCLPRLDRSVAPGDTGPGPSRPYASFSCARLRYIRSLDSRVLFPMAHRCVGAEAVLDSVWRPTLEAPVVSCAPGPGRTNPRPSLGGLNLSAVVKHAVGLDALEASDWRPVAVHGRSYAVGAGVSLPR